MNYSFSVEHAQQYGVNEAIMLENFIFWIRKNAANKRHQYDGKTWTYNSKKAFTKLFSFWSYDQVKGVLNSLVNQGVLVTGNYNKFKFDRTLWYALKDEQLFLFPATENTIEKLLTHENQPLGEIPQSNEVLSPNGVGEITQPIPDKKPNIKNSDKNNNSSPSITEIFPAVVVELEKTFSSEEMPAAKKIITSVPAQIQLEVLAVLVAMLKTTNVKNKLGYLRGIINSVQDGTFTPLPAQTKPINAEERIQQEKRKQLEAENRGKVDNVSFFADLYKKCGSLAAIPAQYLQAVKEQLALQGIVLAGC